MNEKTEGGILSYIKTMSEKLRYEYEINYVYLDGYYDVDDISDMELEHVHEYRLSDQNERDKVIKSLDKGGNILVFTQVAIAKMFISFYEKNTVFVQYHRLYRHISKPVKKDLYICEKHIKKGKIQIIGEKNYEEIKNGLTEKFTYEKNYVKEMKVQRVNKEKKILYVGRLTRKDDNSKNIDELIKILTELSQEYKIEVYGNGECYSEIAEISDNIEMMGYEDNIEKIYSKKDLLILPSKSESEGRVLKEAIMAGIPVVTYDSTAEMENIIVDSRIGYVVEMNKTEKFIRAVKKSLGDDTFGKRVYRNKIACENYGSELIVNEFNNITRKLKPYKKYRKFKPKVYAYRQDEEYIYCMIGGNFFVCPQKHTLSHDYTWKTSRSHYFMNNFLKLLPDQYNKGKIIINDSEIEIKKIEELINVPLRAKIYRLIAKSYSLFNKDVVLYQDRRENADDNAEILYEKNCYENAYFVIDKKSPSYQKLKEKGYNIVSFGSFKHKLLFLNAKLIISSHLQKNMYSPFQYSSYYYYNDFYRSKFVFLQHGVISHDHHIFMNPHKNAVDLFISSSANEQKLIKDFGYKNVAITGLARFDKYEQVEKNVVQNKVEKTLLYFVTWNENYKYNIEKNEMTKSIVSLLKNDELKAICKANNLKIKLVPHLNLLNVFEQYKDSHIDVLNPSEIVFNEVINSSDILLTDTSSIMYDFAYMKKPVITYVPYKRNYGEKIIENDDFIFNTVLETEVISQLEKILSNGFVNSDEENEKIEKFFGNIDKNNRLRIINEINKL